MADPPALVGPDIAHLEDREPDPGVILVPIEFSAKECRQMDAFLRVLRKLDGSSDGLRSREGLLRQIWRLRSEELPDEVRRSIDPELPPDDFALSI